MKRILIIEDDTDINNVITETLTKSGYCCTQAFSGTEALLCLEKESYALAVMDLMLPGLPCEELLPKLKGSDIEPQIDFWRIPPAVALLPGWGFRLPRDWQKKWAAP